MFKEERLIYKNGPEYQEFEGGSEVDTESSLSALRQELDSNPKRIYQEVEGLERRIQDMKERVLVALDNGPSSELDSLEYELDQAVTLNIMAVAGRLPIYHLSQTEENTLKEKLDDFSDEVDYMLAAVREAKRK